MSLNSLRSLTGAASLATTALDTARSTIKAMAEAATQAGEQSGKARERKPAPVRSEVAPVAEAKPGGGERKGVRQGLRLDAYA
jgi:hypothetical protein